MTNPKWQVSRYGSNYLHLAPEFNLVIEWDSMSPKGQSKGYQGTVNGLKVKQTSNDIEVVKAATIQAAKQYVDQISKALEAL